MRIGWQGIALCRDKGAKGGEDSWKGKHFTGVFMQVYRSPQSNMRVLECSMLSDNLDIVAISETWNGENQWDTVIPRYKPYKQDRKGWLEGHVKFYIKEDLDQMRKY